TAYAEVCEVRILYSADLLPGADASAQDASDTAADHRRSEIAFVDATLDNADQLIETLQLLAGDDVDLEIIRINADEDGLDLISRSLAGRSDIDAIHVFTHGQAGMVELGSVQLDADSLLARSTQIAT